MTDYDVIIVGAGSAGSVLAARLSENGRRSVLVLEAGAGYSKAGEFPNDLLQANLFAASVPGHPANWTFMAKLTAELSLPITRGKVVGGSSAINGGYFVRGTRTDFDGWARRGNDAWSFDDVLPCFKRLERDLDFDGPDHGVDGPMPVRRQRGQELSASGEAFLQACSELGFPEDNDKNAPDSEGAGPFPLNCIDGVRINTAIAYLIPALARSQLTVMSDTFVRRVVFSGQRAVGVEVEQRGRQEIIWGGEIIVCAGAVKSPQLLMLSGVGPADELRAVGIEVVHDSPGVGKGFSDHPDILLRYRTRDDPRFNPAAAVFQTGLNYTAEDSEFVADMEIAASSCSMATAISGRRSNLALREAVATLRRPVRTVRAIRGASPRQLVKYARHQADLMLACILQQPYSRGELRLTAGDPHAAPWLSYHYLEDGRDLARLRGALRLAAELLETRPFKRLGAMRTSLTDDVLTSDDALDLWMRANLTTDIHMSCSCRMGPVTDSSAVVDQYGRVHGLEGLRVVDGSIMPTIVRRGPHATVVMIAERVAEFLT